MLDQIMILDSGENLAAVFSNTIPEACAIIEQREQKEMMAGGIYSDICLLTIPADHIDAQHIVNGNYIVFEDADGYYQEYKIIDTSREDAQAESRIVATCEHAFYELYGEAIDDIRPTETTASLAVIQALDGTRWEIGTGADLGNNSTRIYKTKVLNALSQIATVWGGELRFYIEVIAGVIVSRKVDILASIGNVTGKRFEFRKDLVSIRYNENMQNLATALIGRGKGVEVYGGTETTDPAYGRRLEFDEIVWTVAGGDPADKPYGQNWIGDDTAAAAYGPGGRHIKDFIELDDCTDAEELLQLTYDKLQERKAPLCTYEMAVITLEELSGYEHEAVRLGDTVNVINAAASPAITGTARVIKIDKNLINPADCAVTLGNYIPSMVNTLVKTQAKQSALTARSGVWDRANAIEAYTGTLGELEHRIDLLKTQLFSTVTGFSTDENGNFLFENADQTAAVKIGGGILALASTKTSGEYDWRTFVTGSGATADEILTGTLNAAIVFAGILQAASGTFADLVAGIANAQRMHFGTDEFNDPFLDFYDNLNTKNLRLHKHGYNVGSTSTIKFEVGDLYGIGTFIE
jgi:phage minor structural protein